MKKLIPVIVLLVTFSASAQKHLQTQTAGSIGFYGDRINQLLTAVPDDKLDWSPQEGVRSFAQVFGHVISANYFFAVKMGATPPEGVNMQTIENDVKTKADIKKHLDASLQLLIGALNGIEDANLADKVEFPFPGDYTVTSAILISLSHVNEHLGQLIAYSRMNGITPPWSN